MPKTVRPLSLPGTTDPQVQTWEKDHAALSRQAAAEGIVLLENREHLLPLAAGTRLAVYGAGAYDTIKGGTGSGEVNERYRVSVAEGLRDAGFIIANERWLSDYSCIYKDAKAAWREYVLNQTNEEISVITSYFLNPFPIPVGPKVTKTDTDTAVYVISRSSGEGLERKAAESDYYLSREEHAMLSDICSLYRHVIVLVNTGGVIDLSFMDEFEEIQALLIISCPGMEGGNAVADILSGQVTPSGKLTDTWAYRYEDYPSSATFSENDGNIDKEFYTEGIYVGYRYFDSFHVPARYGFGEGLSYTTFDIRTRSVVLKPDGEVHIPVTVTNTGSYPGKEVVQIYVSLPEGRLEKEFRRLAAFAKTGFLNPGESEEMRLVFGTDEVSSYDEASAAWIMEAGDYIIFVGDSLKNATASFVLHLGKDITVKKTDNICPLTEDLNELSRQDKYDTSSLTDGLTVLKWDLSDIPACIVDYTAEPEKDEADKIVSGLSVEQLVQLATGDPEKAQETAAYGKPGNSVPGSAAETSSCAIENGIANIVLSDGPAGLRLNQFYYAKDGVPMSMPFETALDHGIFIDWSQPMEGIKYYQFCTAIPIGTMLAQTWNLKLTETIGTMVGDEMKRFGITLWLAPGMNIHRNPLCGRNFEYYSEDPLISGKMAASITRGVQKNEGCGTTIKHFACNNQEANRMQNNSILSERALREIYLRGFGIAIRESQPFAMMSSYNRINGIYAANNYDTCTKVARKEFGFKGIIMTDWTTTEQSPDCTAAGCMRAGNNLVMPGRFSNHESIRIALADGSLSLEQLKRCIAYTVRIILKADRYEKSGGQNAN